MKNLYYLSTISYYQTDIGVLHLLAKNFNITYGVIVLKNSYPGIEKELAEYCLKYNINYIPFHFKKRLRDLRIGIEFIKIISSINRNKPDIIYSFCFDSPVFSLLGLILNRTKTIIFIHDLKFHNSTPFLFPLKIGRKITLSYFQNFQVFSNNQLQIFKKKFPKKQIHIISLPLTDLGAPRKNINVALQEKQITKFLFFGNILPYKNLELLIMSLNSLNHKCLDFELTIAGNCDNWEEYYEPLIDDKSRIKKIIRHIKNEEIIELLSNCHYLVLPYKEATQSGPLMIAYNYNKPVIASNIPAFKESIEEGKSGYLFENQNQKKLEVVLEFAIKQKEEEYNLLLKSLESYVKANFPINTIAEKYELMFSSIQ